MISKSKVADPRLAMLRNEWASFFLGYSQSYGVRQEGKQLTRVELLKEARKLYSNIHD